MKNLLLGAFLTLLAINHNDCSVFKKSRLNLKELQTLPEQFLNVVSFVNCDFMEQMLQPHFHVLKLTLS